MKYITAEQMQWVLNDLPPPWEVKGDYCRVPVREYPPTTLQEERVVRDNARFFDFRKVEGRWVFEFFVVPVAEGEQP